MLKKSLKQALTSYLKQQISDVRSIEKVFKFSVVTTASSTVFTLPLTSTGEYDFIVSWGDGSTYTITSYNDAAKNHTYASSGTYIVEITGTITGWAFNNSSSAPLFKTVYSWGELVLDPNGYQFYGCSNMTWSGTAIGGPNTSNVTNMQYMFYGCTNFNQPVSNFDTSNVTNMSYMFRGCTNFNKSVSNFNTSKVTNMQYMFYSCTNFNQPVSNFNTSKVTNMQYMFYGCINFNQPVSNFDTSNVTNMSYMFRSCTNFNKSVSNFDTSKVTNMQYMFYGVTLSTSYYDAALIAWAPKVLTGSYSFHGGNSKYTAGGVAEAARSAWQAKGWIVTDGGKA